MSPAYRVLTITRVVIVLAICIPLLIYRPPFYGPLLFAIIGALVVFPLVMAAIFKSRLRKQKNG